MITVPEKNLPNFNFAMPEEIAAEFRRIGDVRGERNKQRWAVAAVAVLSLLELPEDEIHRRIRDVIGARGYPEILKDMIDASKLKAKRGTIKASEARIGREKKPDSPRRQSELSSTGLTDRKPGK